jgi:hypothetical protein
MSRVTSVVVVALAGAAAFAGSGGCGRLAFDLLGHEPSDAQPGDDAAADATPADVTSRCAVLLHMDEAAWIDHGSGSGSGSGSVRAAVTPTDLVNACDAANPGLASGSASPVSDPIRGTVGRFDANTCVQIKDEVPTRATTAVTTSAWIKMTGDPAGSFGVVSKRVSAGSGEEYDMFVWTGSRVYADIDSEDDRFPGRGTVPTGVWTQLTMVYDGAQLPAARVRIYVDGVLDTIGGETSARITQSGSPLSIGCLPLGGIAQSFEGELDDVAVWTRALTDRDVAAWYAMTRR